MKNGILNPNYKHGMSGSRIYKIYLHMKDRCLNKSCSDYRFYGEKGVIICEEWLGENGFINFLKWSMENGYSKELTIDRINYRGDYEPSNCRWISIQEQQSNRVDNQYIEYNGQSHTLSEWSRILNISQSLLWYRINKYDWSVERAFSSPPRKYGVKQ